MSWSGCMAARSRWRAASMRARRCRCESRSARAHLPADRVSETSGPAGRTALPPPRSWRRRCAGCPDEQDVRSTGEPMLESSRLLSSLDTESPPAGAERRRILLADDNADMRDYVTRLLRPGYEIATARRRAGGFAPGADDPARPDSVGRDDATNGRFRAAGRNSRRSPSCATCRSSCSPPARVRKRVWKGLTRAPMTTWSSRSRRASCWRGFVPIWSSRG